MRFQGELDERIREELSIAISKGWLAHVLSSDRWWIDADGKIRPIRRQNFWVAYVDMRGQIENKLRRDRTLYRTLLLSENFDISSLTDRSQDYGQFWTLSREVADNYQPRRYYQSKHRMPIKGYPYVVTVDDVSHEEIDWVASVCCQLGNPRLEEIRLKQGLQKKATRVDRGLAGEGLLITSMNMPTHEPAVPEGPGFIDNFRWLNQSYQE